MSLTVGGFDLQDSYRCDHGSEAPERILVQLSPSQAGTARHKCAVCAYREGRAAGVRPAYETSFEDCPHGNAAPTKILAFLPDSQAGPGVQRHKCCICAYRKGFEQAASLIEFYNADELIGRDALHEGAAKTVTVNAYERNPIARQRCIEYYGDKCSACGFKFETRYGPAGKGLIHVHHLQPLASLGQEYQVDPVKDLRPICPNCHAMIHRKDPPFTIEELQSMLSHSTT